MKFYQVASFIFLFCICLPLASQDQLFARPRRYKKHYCGEELVNTLKFFCDTYKKRSEFEPLKVEENNPEYVPRWLSRTDALLAVRLRRSIKRGAVDECCKKPCYMKELLGYCGSFGSGWTLYGVDGNGTELF